MKNTNNNTKRNQEFAGIATSELEDALNLISKAVEILNPGLLNLNDLSKAKKDTALNLRLINICLFNEIMIRKNNK